MNEETGQKFLYKLVMYKNFYGKVVEGYVVDYYETEGKLFLVIRDCNCGNLKIVREVDYVWLV